MSQELKLRRLTSPGRGAVAVLQVRTSHGHLLNQHFRAANGMSAGSAAVNRILYGIWDSEDVVVVRTASTEWEVHCHGGEAAIRKIAVDLQTSASPENLSMAAPSADPWADELPDTHQAITDPSWQPEPHGLPQYLDQLQHHLLQLLLRCRTRTTAAYLLAQQQGQLTSFLTKLQTHSQDQSLRQEVHRFLQWSNFAAHLTDPWQVAICGQPNAGKSSLLNAIVGFDRSIVYDQPGTTRDFVEAEIVLQDWPLRIVDTAGIRELPEDSIEMQGVASARRSLVESDVCLLVVDATCGLTAKDLDLLATVPPATPTAILLNKIDLIPDNPRRAQLIRDTQTAIAQALPRFACDTDDPATVGRDLLLATSANSREGLNELLDWLPAVLVPSQPEFTEPLPVLPEVAALATHWLNSG